MKTSEEIKKGLEHCEKEMCKKCPYEADCNMEDAFTGLSFDALTLIQQLEAENAELLEKITMLEAGIAEFEMVAASPGAVEDMARENAELKRERDAAVRDLGKARGCKTCKHITLSPEDRPCRSCGICGRNYEWRGPCEENTENT